MVLLLMLAALIPTLIYVGLFWWLDRYEKEPWGLFAAAFLYGCFPAVILSIILEVAVGGSDAFATTIVAPIVEEGVKGAAVLLIFLLWRREFDGVLDGILYGAVVGLGFAMVENFFYFMDTSGNPMVIFLRAIVFGMNHAFFTAFTGAALGLARQSRWRSSWLLLFPLGLLIAMAFHAIHNGSVGAGACLGLGVALVSDWGGVAVIVAVALLTGRQEKRWIREELGEEVAGGLLAQSDVEALHSLRRRIYARFWMWRHRGWKAYRLLGRYLNQATELAFRKHHLRREPGNAHLVKEIYRLREQILQLRGALLGQTAGQPPK